MKTIKKINYKIIIAALVTGLLVFVLAIAGITLYASVADVKFQRLTWVDIVSSHQSTCHRHVLVEAVEVAVAHIETGTSHRTEFQRIF